MTPCEQARRFPVRFAPVALWLALAGCGSPQIAPEQTVPVTSITSSRTPVTVPGAIQSGDTLEVIVRRGAGEERFTPVVKEDGKVAVGVVEERVVGLTAGQAEELLRIRLSPFIREPRVQVIVRQRAIPTQKVFVFGEVKKPGVYPLATGATLLQAVAMADGYTGSAVLESTRVIREDGGGSIVIASNLERLLKQGDRGQDLLLQDGDIVYLPRERIGDWNAFLAKIRPSLEILTLPLQSVLQLLILNEAVK